MEAPTVRRVRVRCFVVMRRVVAGLGLSILASAAPGWVASAESGGTVAFVPLGDLPGGDFYSIATRVSADGSTVVGYSRSSVAADPLEAFRWTEAQGMVGLGGLASPPDTRGRGVSADGSLVVLSGAGPWPIFWTESGGLVEVPDTTGTLQRAVPLDLSADGSTVVGFAHETTEPANQAFRWTAAGGFEPLGWLPSTIHDSFMTAASADGSVLAGFSFHEGSDVEPMLWTEAAGLDSLGDVPGGDPYALAWGISDDGTTVVGDAHIGETSEPWLWREDTGFVRPDPFHGAEGGGWFEAVSADGAVAVGVPAIVWDAGHGIRRLEDVLLDAGVDISGWLLQGARDVSADGRTIVGYGRNPAGDTEAWLVRMPTATATPVASGRAKLALVPLGTNPTRGACTFRLGLTVPDRVRAHVVSVSGRIVRSIVDAPLAEGRPVLAWDGRDAAGRPVASGTYFLRATAGDAAVTRKIVLLR